MNKHNIFTMTDGQSGERLDKFLVATFPEQSRSHWQKAIKDGHVLVNDKIVSPHYFLSAGEEVKIQTEKIAPVTDKKILPEKFKLKIISETDDYVVVDKPAGIIVHPTDQIFSGTLVNFLLAKYPELIKIGDDPTRPGIVHRLDQPVSGLMVIARSPKMFDYLKKQFQDRDVKKIYQALVVGEVNQDEGLIDFPLARSTRRLGKIAARPMNQEGRDAKTKFKVIKRYHGYTLLEVEILTGRTHQIRAHLASIGHPIIGDALYGGANKKWKLDRIFLHSSYLRFNDLQGTFCEFKSNLPGDLKNFLKSDIMGITRV